MVRIVAVGVTTWSVDGAGVADAAGAAVRTSAVIWGSSSGMGVLRARGSDRPTGCMGSGQGQGETGGGAGGAGGRVRPWGSPRGAGADRPRRAVGEAHRWVRR